MAGIFDANQIEIPCEACGHKTKKSIGWIKNHSALVCLCGTRIALDANQFKREIAKIERSAADLKRAIKKFGK